MEIPKSAAFKEQSEGHEDIWDCTLDEFIEKVMPVLQEKITKHKLTPKVVSMTASFLRISFDKKELTGTIEYEVNKNIDYAGMCIVNVLGEDL